jgi:hypothetical protein
MYLRPIQSGSRYGSGFLTVFKTTENVHWIKSTKRLHILSVCATFHNFLPLCPELRSGFPTQIRIRRSLNPDPAILTSGKVWTFSGSFRIREGNNLGDRVGGSELFSLDPDPDPVLSGFFGSRFGSGSSLSNKIYRSSFGSDPQHSLLGGHLYGVPNHTL